MFTPLFTTGQVVATPGALANLEEHNTNVKSLLMRHLQGDWGDLTEGDKRANDEALKTGERILSSYKLTPTQKVWIITEWDRSYTTVLNPEDY